MSFQIENFLLSQKLVTREQLDKALSEKGRSRVPLLDALEYLKFVDKKNVIDLLEKRFRVKYVDLASLDLNPEVVRMIPETLIKRFMAIPLRVEKEALATAMVDPSDVLAIDRIQAATGRQIIPFLTTEDEFKLVFDKFYLDIFAEKVVGEAKIEAPKEILEEDLFKRVSEDNRESLVVQLFNAIVVQAVRSRATDIHIEPQEKELYIRFRVDGLLQTMQKLPKGTQPLLISRVKVLAEMDISDSRLPQDGQLRMRLADRELDLRISTIPGLYGEKVAIRVLDKSSFTFGLSQLGMPAELQSRYEDFIFKPNGIILVTGPTGSGKTTTLYSTLSRIRTPEKNILTLEDPIEYELLAGSSREGGITQVQIVPKAGFTFADGLRAFLRQDPDIIMVGEIRDRETADVAVTASQTGRLVLSTLHTKDTITSIDRLLNLGIEPYLMSHSLLCLITQRLLRTLCPYCKKSYPAPKGVLEKMGIPSTKKIELFREVGCPKCNHSGYLGRSGIFELLPITPKLRELIDQRANADALLAAARQEGFKTLGENSLALVLDGSTTVSEMMRVLPGSD